MVSSAVAASGVLSLSNSAGLSFMSVLSSSEASFAAGLSGPARVFDFVFFFFFLCFDLATVALLSPTAESSLHSISLSETILSTPLSASSSTATSIPLSVCSAVRVVVLDEDRFFFFFFDFFLFFPVVDVVGPWEISSISELKFILSSCASDICISAPLLSISPVPVPAPRGADLGPFERVFFFFFFLCTFLTSAGKQTSSGVVA
mmetsp:Transcript_6960/g.10459  ORF Transcript_6960/g.10459 Transcript_6960/m.10459 type:complete len:205 (-) Transcript_6960:319-933(-)